MKIERGRPHIDKDDHPTTIYRALGQSMDAWDEEYTEDQANWWSHIAQNERESLRDAFCFLYPNEKEIWKPEGEYTLLMSMDQLEYALVSYASYLLEKDDPLNADETKALLADTDEILQSIDKALNRKKISSNS